MIKARLVSVSLREKSEKNGPLPPLFIFASVVCKRLLAKKDILSNFCILSAQVEAERMKRAAVLKSEGKKKKKKKITRISNAFPLAFISSIKSLIIINCVNCFFRIYLYRFVGF